MRLLEQYQSRLHGSNDSYEELDYIKQILGSPIFQEYLDGGVPTLQRKETQDIVQASVDILSGIAGSSLEDGRISPAEKHRRKLHRKKSLKALKNAVTSNTPSSTQVKPPHTTEAMSGALGEAYLTNGQEKQLHPLSEPHIHSNTSIASNRDRKFSYGSKLGNNPSSPHSYLIFPAAVNGTENSFVGGEQNGRTNILSDLVSPSSHVNSHDRNIESMSLMDARSKHLSSSSNMLIERPSPPKEFPGIAATPGSFTASSATGRRRRMSKEGMFGGEVKQTSLTGSQPNISRLRIAPPRAIEFDNLMSNGGGVGDVNNTTSGGHTMINLAGGTRGREPLEWNNHMGAIRGQVPVLNPANPSTAGVAAVTANKLMLAPVSPSMARPPPPYNFTHMMQGQTSINQATPLAPPTYMGSTQPLRIKTRRTNSDIRVLGFDGDMAQPELIPLATPMTDRLATKDLPTAERRKLSHVINLRKGKEGLGFRLKKEEEGGEVFVQYLQVGGVADR